MKGFPVAQLGNSDELQVGDWVLAVGNPMGFESTVTQGIISAKSRREGPDSTGFTDYIQTDAAINQGNSGGALVNLDGEVVGINTWIVSQSGGSIGLGFAIPINNAKKAIDDFITKGNVEYGWLGVHMGTLTDNVAQSMNLDGKKGAFVFNLYQNSPAMDSGLEPGDLITTVDNKSYRNQYRSYQHHCQRQPRCIGQRDLYQKGPGVQYGCHPGHQKRSDRPTARR